MASQDASLITLLNLGHRMKIKIKPNTITMNYRKCFYNKQQ